MKITTLSLAVIASLTLLSGCGSSSSNDTQESESISKITGQFIDSAVEGLDYSCSSSSTGTTNTNGEFTCNSGDTVTFSLNSFTLGSCEAAAVVTPNTLYPNSNEQALNVAQLLQTLDSDNNTSNGIKINSTMSDFLQNANIDISAVDFDSVVSSYIGKVLIGETEALAHMNGNDSSNSSADSSSDDTNASTGGPDSNASTDNTSNAIAYGTITSSVTGKVWLDRNLGASQVCTSYNDEACYGDYYQWGRAADGHEKSNSASTPTKASSITVGHGNFIKGTSDWTTADSDGLTRSANWNICPSGFRLPTAIELESENISDRDDAFDKLKFPSSGRREGSGSLSTGMDGQVCGGHWSNSLSASSPQYLFFDNEISYVNTRIYTVGFPVRCIED